VSCWLLSLSAAFYSSRCISMTEPVQVGEKRGREPEEMQGSSGAESQRICFPYLNHGYCQRGAECKFRHLEQDHPDAIADRIRTGHVNKLTGMVAPEKLQEMKKQVTQSNLSSSGPICFGFLNTGRCDHGDHCKYRHIGQDHPDAIADRVRRGEFHKIPPGVNPFPDENPNVAPGETRICFPYLNQGKCEKPGCTFRHLPPTHPEAIADRARNGRGPAPGPSAFGAGLGVGMGVGMGAGMMQPPMQPPLMQPPPMQPPMQPPPMAAMGYPGYGMAQEWGGGATSIMPAPSGDGAPPAVAPADMMQQQQQQMMMMQQFGQPAMDPAAMASWRMWQQYYGAHMGGAGMGAGMAPPMPMGHGPAMGAGMAPIGSAMGGGMPMPMMGGARGGAAGSESRICFPFLNKGACARGDQCKFRHLSQDHPDAIADRIKTGHLHRLPPSNA